jgi:hypothetical protein
VPRDQLPVERSRLVQIRRGPLAAPTCRCRIVASSVSPQASHASTVAQSAAGTADAAMEAQSAVDLRHRVGRRRDVPPGRGARGAASNDCVRGRPQRAHRQAVRGADTRRGGAGDPHDHHRGGRTGRTTRNARRRPQLRHLDRVPGRGCGDALGGAGQVAVGPRAPHRGHRGRPHAAVPVVRPRAHPGASSPPSPPAAAARAIGPRTVHAPRAALYRAARLSDRTRRRRRLPPGRERRVVLGRPSPR